MTKCPSCGHEWMIKTGPRSKISDKTFRAAIEETSGHITNAAINLGIKTGTALARARRLGIKGCGLPGRRSDITNESILKLLEETGTISNAAESLGVSASFIYGRVGRLPEYVELKKRIKGLRYCGIKQARHLEVARAIAEANGNMTGAAVILGISRERVRQIFNRTIEGDDEVSSV